MWFSLLNFKNFVLAVCDVSRAMSHVHPRTWVSALQAIGLDPRQSRAFAWCMTAVTQLLHTVTLRSMFQYV
jgi:hypothetical protein